MTARLVRPLNHSYIGNLGNVWPGFADPWYDGEARYSVPYSVYTTGVGWRTDQVPDDVAALDQPVRRAVGPGVQRQGRGHRRLAHRDGHGGSARRHHRRQHRQVRGPAIIQEDLTELSKAASAQGHRVDVQRPALGPARDQPDVVGRHRQRAVLPARGPVGRDPALLVPRRRHGPGRQRPDDGAQRRQEPGARPPVPRAHARREELPEELRLHRLPAAPDGRSTPSGWSPTATCPRTSPPPPSGRSGSTSATACWS